MRALIELHGAADMPANAQLMQPWLSSKRARHVKRQAHSLSCRDSIERSFSRHHRAERYGRGGATEVDLLLALAAVVFGSVDDQKFALQHEGCSAAVTNGIFFSDKSAQRSCLSN
ncbi:MAG: hypothetical protein WB822_08415 [Rhodoplanes sp.]